MDHPDWRNVKRGDLARSTLRRIWGRKKIPVKPGLTALALTALLSLNLNLMPAARAQQTPSPVPDAPAPQTSTPLTDATGPIKPGGGAGTETPAGASSSATDAQQPPGFKPAAPAQAPKEPAQSTPPDMPPVSDFGNLIRLNVTYV